MHKAFGKYLFPLSLILSGNEDMFIDDEARIYQGVREDGAIGCVAFSPLTEEDGIVTIKRDDRNVAFFPAILLARAKAHASWARYQQEPQQNDQKSILEKIRARKKQIYQIDDEDPSIHDGIQLRGWVIGSIDEGKLLFSDNPKIHLTEESFKKEMTRLANLSPGTKMVGLRICSAVTAGELLWE